MDVRICSVTAGLCGSAHFGKHTDVCMEGGISCGYNNREVGQSFSFSAPALGEVTVTFSSIPVYL